MDRHRRSPVCRTVLRGHTGAPPPRSAGPPDDAGGGSPDRGPSGASVGPDRVHFPRLALRIDAPGLLLGLDPQVIVLSEVPVLDEWLRSSLAERDPLFAATLRLLGQRRFGNEHALFVKTDCWHIFFADRLRRLYPETPFILLYRSPEAVLVSHRKIRGTQMVQGPSRTPRSRSHSTRLYRTWTSMPPRCRRSLSCNVGGLLARSQQPAPVVR